MSGFSRRFAGEFAAIGFYPKPVLAETKWFVGIMPAWRRFKLNRFAQERNWFAGLGGRVADSGHSVHTERKRYACQNIRGMHIDGIAGMYFILSVMGGAASAAVLAIADMCFILSHLARFSNKLYAIRI